MNGPTLLSPWYAVQRYTSTCDLQENEQQCCTGRGEVEYYTSMEDGGTEFTRDPKRAMLFMSLASAARIADQSVAEIRVLTNNDHAEEFGRGQS